MADASRHSSFSNLPPPPTPRDWHEAFAALPQEAPDASRWPALAQAVAARSAVRARRRRIGLALAAGLCALALVPLALRRTHDALPPTNADTPRTATTQTATAPPTETTPVTTAPPPTTPRHADPAPSITVAAADATPRAAPTRVRAARHAGPREDRRALATRRQAPRTAAAAATDATTTTDAADSLDALYAASAQLEALLTLTRDPRVDSGPAAALAGDYDDARLAQPDVSLDEQRRLWRARVDLLQQATGLESQLRVLAASGRRLDGALVRVD